MFSQAWFLKGQVKADREARSVSPYLIEFFTMSNTLGFFSISQQDKISV